MRRPPPPAARPPTTWPDGIPHAPGPSPGGPPGPINHTVNRRHMPPIPGPRPRHPPPPPPNWPKAVIPGRPIQLSELPSRVEESPLIAFLREGHESPININIRNAKHKSRVKSEPSKGLLAWMAGSSAKRRKGKTYGKDVFAYPFVREKSDNRRPSSSIEREEKTRRQAFLQQDPLNIHQTILKNLQGSTRAPVTSVYDLAKLVTNSCVEAFDQYKIPPDFQFFDFFERSIGAVVRKTSIHSGN